MIKLNKKASVVEYGAARKIIFQLGLNARRENDDLLIFKGVEDKSFSLYTKANKEKVFSTMYVDEGMFSDVLMIDGKVQDFSEPWQEFVDYCNLISIVISVLLPDAERPRSSAIGRGRHTRDLIAGYHKLLADVKNVEFVD